MLPAPSAPPKRPCPLCGSPLPSGLGALLCPVCALTDAGGYEEDEEDDVMDGRPDDALGSPGLEQSVRGMKFGRYTLAGEIGRGGMGIVYRATQDRLGREVALKLLPGSALMTEEWERRFKMEAESIARLNHPHVVKVIEAGEHRGQLFIVMALICGDNLATRLQDGPLEATRAAQLMQQIADAVAHTHAHDVLHRDLKPCNILIDDTGQAMLVDFGLARPLSGSEAMTQLAIGSPHYMPPERLDPHSSTAAEAVSGDIYGLGSVLYHCLTGIPPHSGESVGAILASMAEREPVAPRLLRPGLPRDLETICLKCLERQPAARYPSAAEVRDELGRFLRGEPTRARPVSAAERLWRWGRRHQALSVLTLGLLLAIGTGTTVSLLGWKQAAQQTNLTKAANESLRRQSYASDLAAAGSAFRDANPPLVQLLLDRQIPQPGQSDLRGIEWYYLKHQLQPQHVLRMEAHPHIVTGLAWSPDGRRLLSIDHSGSVRGWLWDEEKNRSPVSSQLSQNSLTD